MKRREVVIGIGATAAAAVVPTLAASAVGNAGSRPPIGSECSILVPGSAGDFASALTDIDGAKKAMEQQRMVLIELDSESFEWRESWPEWSDIPLWRATGKCVAHTGV